MLQSAGYFDNGRGDPNKLTEVTPPKPTPAGAPEPLTDAEKQGLTGLHHNAVGTFVAGPGFGFSRMPVFIDDLLAKPKSLSESDVANKRLPFAPVPVILAESPKPGEQPKNVHHPVQNTVARGLGWGNVLLTEDKKQQWKMRKINLVGLVKHPEPVVYLTDKVPNMKDVKDVPTRELDAFEKAALESLRGGESVKAEKHGKEMRMVGPIYAGNSCVKCHDQKGEMLGAFTYHLELVPVEEPKGERVP